MNKYDYGYVIHPNTTTSFAFETVAEGSEVLEIGSSNGNLTKHLAEEKGCAVDIVEINAEAGEQASRFARTGLTGPSEGDLEGDLWLQKLGDRRYDYIVVLDVLEHLREPETVLLRLKGLLREEGAIILSVPNMAHNSVLIDMIRNHLQYNELGILDNTHLRFFTQGTLDRMVHACGLCATEKRAIQMPVGSNEIKNSYNDLPAEWAVLLKARPLAEVFQFIYVLRTHGSEAALASTPLDTTKRLIKLYYKDSETDFFDEERIRFRYVDGQETEAAFDLSDTEAAVIRVNLLDEPCVLESLQVRLTGEDGKEYAVDYETNGTRLKDGCFVFSSQPPEVLLRVPDGHAVSGVKVSFNALLYGQAQIDAIERCAREWWEYLRVLETRTREAAEAFEEQRGTVAQLEAEGEERRQWITQLEDGIQYRDSRIQQLELDCDERLQYITQLEQNCRAQGDHLAQLERDCGEQTQHIAQLEQGRVEQSERIAQLEREDEERRQWIAHLEEGVQYRDGRIQQLELDCDERLQYITQLEQSCRAQGDHLARLEQNCAEQTERIAQLERESEERRQWIAHLEDGIQYRDGKIAHLEDGIQYRDDKIAHLEDGIQYRDDRIARQDELLMLADEGTKRFEPGIPELRQRLTLLFASKIWRFACFLQKCKRKMTLKNKL
ncbi:MAG: methyltransferase domain-containing protein [Christensenellaceae bacterium]|nr:methyltransferase domain-containing protein [Christensenellaceae bacterium]